jgi:hypothetical protein
MLIDLIPLKEAIARLPKPYGKPVDLHTVQRWIRKGIGGTKLRAQRIGGRWFTSDEWINDFIHARTQESVDVDVYALAAERTRRSQEAKEWLDARRQRNGKGKQGSVPRLQERA